jgi:hypothetical protein
LRFCTTVIVGVDRLGRRRALLIGSAGAAFSLYYIAIYSAVSGSFEKAPPRDGGSYFALVSIYLFSVFYAFSWNGIPWIFCAEVFPSGIRAVCTVITTMNQWLSQVSTFANVVTLVANFSDLGISLNSALTQFVIAYSFPYMVAGIEYGVFILFGTAVVLGAIFVFFLIPETSNISL